MRTTNAVDRARVRAAEAARAAHVSVRMADTLAELTSVTDLLNAMWGRTGDETELSVGIVRALRSSGSYIALAEDEDGVVAGSVAFFTDPRARGLHSHLTGVVSGLRHTGVGYALKTHQRAWALAQGIDEISWTFDPLIRRNAYFNLGKLNARPTKYLPDFYGSRAHEVNGADPTDRLLVRWDVADPAVELALDGAGPALAFEELRRDGAAVLLDRGQDGQPLLEDVRGRVGLIAVPEDIERLRAADRALAHDWRLALREAMQRVFDSGGNITGFASDGWYVVSYAGTPTAW